MNKCSFFNLVFNLLLSVPGPDLVYLNLTWIALIPQSEPLLSTTFSMQKNNNNQKPPLSPSSCATPMPLHISHFPFIANYWGFLLLFIKKAYFPLSAIYGEAFDAISDTQVLFPDISVLFCGNEGFFSPAIHLTARTFQLMSGAEGHLHKDQQLQPLRAPGTPCQIRGLGASVARLAEEHVSRQCSHSQMNNAPY